MRAVRKSLAAAFVAMMVASLAACEREHRRFKESPPAATSASIRQSELQPGAAVTGFGSRNEYEENGYAISEGKRLYDWFNCSGCHAQGGGAIGPPLMDDRWIYGSDPSNIFATIVEGRPNGMPSFGGKIPNYQVWQIAAFVRSMSGLVPKDAASGRNDDMNVKKSEQTEKKQPPTTTRAEHSR